MAGTGAREEKHPAKDNTFTPRAGVTLHKL
jgi:hypothetical protein